MKFVYSIGTGLNLKPWKLIEEALSQDIQQSPVHPLLLLIHTMCLLKKFVVCPPLLLTFPLTHSPVLCTCFLGFCMFPPHALSCPLHVPPPGAPPALLFLSFTSFLDMQVCSLSSHMPLFHLCSPQHSHHFPSSNPHVMATGNISACALGAGQSAGQLTLVLLPPSTCSGPVY